VGALFGCTALFAAWFFKDGRTDNFFTELVVDAGWDVEGGLASVAGEQVCRVAVVCSRWNEGKDSFLLLEAVKVINESLTSRKWWVKLKEFFGKT
jgi:hypothetical protein